MDDGGKRMNVARLVELITYSTTLNSTNRV